LVSIELTSFKQLRPDVTVLMPEQSVAIVCNQEKGFALALWAVTPLGIGVGAGVGRASMNWIAAVERNRFLT
jgi:hypothetical protein